MYYILLKSFFICVCDFVTITIPNSNKNEIIISTITMISGLYLETVLFHQNLRHQPYNVVIIIHNTGAGSVRGN